MAASLGARRRLLVFAVAALAFAAVAVSTAAGKHPLVRPIPNIQHVPGDRGLTFPPTTSFCLANIGIHCYQPFQLQKAYDLNPLFASGVDGTGSTIVIVDSFGSPTIAHDLGVFDQTFGLPDPPSFKVFQPAGAVPPFDPTNSDMVGWAEETTLDVEWSHVFAPGANIVLLETPVSETEGVQGFPEIVAAENWAIDHNIGDVISMSFGATEQTFPSAKSILDLRSAFINAHGKHVALVAGTSDTGATDFQLNLSDLYTFPVTAWPATDPLVTAIGGTMLDLSDTGDRLAPDAVWNDLNTVGGGAGGGGLSTVFNRPDFQSHLASVVGHSRGVPDISGSAAVDGAVVYYFTFINPGYHLVAGVSEATPEFAGIVADADQANGGRLNDLNKSLYRLDYSNGLVDVTQGNNTFGPFTNSDGNTYTVQGFSAAPGYDLASGLGTFDGDKLVTALAAQH
jgi:subtilase family serine protease